MPTQVTGADILATARSYLGELHDGPDVPRIAREIGAAFPEFASYVTQAYDGMAWCGNFVAYVLMKHGIRPPPIKDGIGFFYVDNWLVFGTKVPIGQQQPGDIALWLGNPHHIAFVAGNGKYCGGNQSDAVTETSFRTPDAIRRAATSTAMAPQPAKPSRRFEACIPLVLRHEGGNDDDPRDPGGRTSRGITQQRWDEWRRAHPGLPSDVWQAPQAEVLAIYREKYWDVLACDSLPPGIDYAVFDFGVNSGPDRSARFLQRIVGAEIDGEIGPETIGKTRNANAADVARRLCDDRLAFLQGLSTWPTFGRGWSNRVNDVRAAALAMTSLQPEPLMPEPQLPAPQGTTLTIDLEKMLETLSRLAALFAALKGTAAAPVTQPAPEPPPTTTPPPKTGFGTGLVGLLLTVALNAFGIVGSPVGPEATPTGQLLPAIFGAITGLGATGKIDRWLAVISTIAGAFKPKSTP